MTWQRSAARAEPVGALRQLNRVGATIEVDVPEREHQLGGQREQRDPSHPSDLATEPLHRLEVHAARQMARL